MHARWYLRWEKVSCLERCLQFRSVLIERERFHYIMCTILCVCVQYVHLFNTVCASVC